MKIQFLLISALAVANAGYSSSIQVSGGYLYGGHGQNSIYEEHVPIIHNGVPVDTPEVQAARAAHFEAHAKASALAAQQPSHGNHLDEYQGVSQIYQKSYYQPQSIYSVGGYSAGGHQYSSHVPADTPEVQQAKAVHFAAVAQAQAQGQSHHHAYRKKRGIYSFAHQPEHYPTIINGVPEETPEVQAAKYQHQVAHAVAKSRAYSHYDDASQYQTYNDQASYYHGGYYHVPVIGKDGVPLDTPEVQAARQQHLLAHYHAKTGNHGYAAGYSGHVPNVGPNGVPFDTPEVQIARAQHLKAHAEETAKHNQWAVHSGYGAEYSHYY